MSQIDQSLSPSTQSDNLLEDLNHVMRARLEKLTRIREMGINPFPYAYHRTSIITTILNKFDSYNDSQEIISLSGRIMSLRLMGKAAFAHIQDESGKIQLYIKKDDIGEKYWELFKLLDIGDIIGTTGHVFITKTGEKTLKSTAFELLSKNIRPLPAVKERDGEVFNEWSDKEERYRQRVVDLIINDDSRKVFINRSRIIQEIRQYFAEIDFIEVETPVLQPLYGGANARPFVTHHNALDRTLYLRIADELYLKRLIAGGLPRVYEIAKDFRNEGIDRFHSPEFTMMECYAAYEDYTFCMNLMETLLPRLARLINDGGYVNWNGQKIDLTPPFRRATMSDLVREYTGIEILGRHKDELAHEVKALGIHLESGWGTGKIIDELFSEKVEPHLINPTFVMDYPKELSPLAKQHRSNPLLVERFELFVNGFEMANSFSELNDPIEQRLRFEEQSRLIEAGDEEGHPIDENFLEALEIGMPPTAGLGVGIDRLVMMLTGTDAIRDVILFPTLRDK